MTLATYFDGNTPNPVEVRLAPSEDGDYIVLSPPDGSDVLWRSSDIRTVFDLPSGADTVLRADQRSDRSALCSACRNAPAAAQPQAARTAQGSRGALPFGQQLR